MSKTKNTRLSRVSTSLGGSRRAERLWQAFAVLSVAALSWWYFVSASRFRGLVLSLGWIGFVLAVLAAALSARKRLAYQGVGRLSTWMSGHLYLGLVAAFAISYHSGLRGGGTLSAWLLVFFELTMITGVLGWIVAKKIPPLLTAMEESPAIMEQLLAVRADCLRGIQELSQAGSADFRKFTEQLLKKETGSWTRMFRFYQRRSTLAGELPAFLKEQEPVLARLQENERSRFERAAEYALRVNKMSAELFLQRLLRGWLTLHVAAMASMFGLAAIHIFSVLYY